MAAFWTAFVLIFIAEMGDKTQFMTLAMSARYSSLVVMSGVFIGTLLVSLLSVVLGETVGRLLPYFWINLLAGIAFIAFGIFTLTGHGEEEAEETLEKEESDDQAVDSPKQKKRFKLNPVLTVASTFFVAELGDKTMLATVAIAGREYQYFWQVWAGSTLGLVLSNALGLVAGKALANKLSAKTLQYSIAAIFCLSGCLALWEAFKK